MARKLFRVGYDHNVLRKGIPISGSFDEESFWKVTATGTVYLRILRMILMSRHVMGSRDVWHDKTRPRRQ